MQNANASQKISEKMQHRLNSNQRRMGMCTKTQKDMIELILAYEHLKHFMEAYGHASMIGTISL